MDDNLEPITKTGKVPAARLRDADAARDMVEKLYDEGDVRRQKSAQIDRMADGGPPYDSETLRKNGQSYRSNTPTMDGAALLSTANVTFYNLFNASANLFEVDLEEIGDPFRREDASEALTQALNRIVHKWNNLYFRYWTVINDYVRQGRGFLSWDTEFEWKPKAVRYHRVLVPNATSIDLDEVDRLVILQEASVSQLWGKIRDKEAAGARGWNVKAVLDSISRATPSSRRQGEDAVDTEMSLRDNDIGTDVQVPTIQLAHIYVKEFATRGRPSRWSHYIVDRNGVAKNGTKLVGTDFLFRYNRQYERFENFCCPFFFEVLDGSWNGASGMGKMIYPIIKHGDRLYNSLLDAVYMRTAINLQAEDASSLRRLSMVQMGAGLNVLPPGLNALPANVLGDLQGALAVGQLHTAMLERNTGIYRGQIQREKGNPETATEARFKYAQSAILSSSATDRWYVQQDRAWTEIVRRMLEDREIRREVDAALAQFGVTRKELAGERKVRAVRAVGNGSTYARQEAVFGMASLVGSLPESGRQRWLNDAIAALAGQDKVPQWNPPPPVRDTPTEQEWEATQENAALATGAPVVRYATQNDFIHAQIHLKFMVGAAQSLQQGAPPAKVLGILDSVGPHTQLHIAAMSMDSLRAAEVKKLLELMGEMGKMADQLRQVVRRQMEEQQNAQPQPDQLQVEMAEKGARLQMDQQATAAKMQMEREKAMGDLQLKREVAAMEMELKKLQVSTDIELRRQQAAANIQEDLATKNQ